MKIKEAGPKSPQWNMDVDAAALQDVPEPLLRFYEWESPSATYGYFVDPWEFLDPMGVEKAGLCLARRPTGGGIIFHGTDLAFSFILPPSHPFYALNSLHSYHAINRRVLAAIYKAGPLLELSNIYSCSRGGFCMAKPTKYDLLLDGKKVGGAAQRKTKYGLLHQTSLCLALPELSWLQSLFLSKSSIPQEIFSTSIGLGLELKESLKKCLIEEFG